MDDLVEFSANEIADLFDDDMFEQCNDDFDSDSLVLNPILNLLQSQSDSVDKGDNKSGEFLLSSTKEIVKDIEAVVCKFRRRFVEWEGSAGEAKFIGEHNIVTGTELMESTVYNENVNMHEMDSGHFLVETFTYTLLITSLEIPVICLAHLSKSSAKTARSFNSKIKAQRMQYKGKSVMKPCFMHKVKISSEKARSGKHFLWKLDIVGNVEDKDLLMQAKQIFNSSHEASTNYETSSEE